MPLCPNGHNQRLGLKCQVCGSPLSYREALSDLKVLPKVKPDFGKTSILTVGYPRLSLSTDYVGEVLSGQIDVRTPTTFQAASIRGGSWLDFYNKYLGELQRWLKIVGFDKASDRIMVVNTKDPVSVLALAALPKLEHTAVLALTADQDSTPIEQNTSYVALSLALKRGLPVVAFSESFEKEMIYFTEDRGFATGPFAMSRLLEPLVGAADDLMDLLERDLKLGVKLHCISAIVAGSKAVYGNAANAFTAQSYNMSVGTKPDEYRTVHCLAFSNGENQGEFEKSFGAYRSRKFKGALNAEFRFRQVSSPLYDVMTIYGLKSEGLLEGLADGYNAIVGSVPELNVDGVR